MLAANLDQHTKKILRWNDEPAFAQNRLRNNRCYIFRRNHPLKRVFQMASTKQVTSRILQRIRTAIAIRVGNPVNIAWKRSEASLVRMRLAGQGQGHHGASVEGILKGDDARPASMRARDLYGILHRLGTAVHKQRLLREPA